MQIYLNKIINKSAKVYFSIAKDIYQNTMYNSKNWELTFQIIIILINKWWYIYIMGCYLVIKNETVSTPKVVRDILVSDKKQVAKQNK